MLCTTQPQRLQRRRDLENQAPPRRGMTVSQTRRTPTSQAATPPVTGPEIEAQERDGFYHIRFNKLTNERLQKIREIRSAVGGRWDPAERCWKIPATPEAWELLVPAGFLEAESPRPEAREPVKAVEIVDSHYRVAIDYDAEKVERLKAISGSRWNQEEQVWIAPVTATATATLAGLGLVEDDPEPDYSRLTGPKLYPFQKEGVRMLCEKRLFALLADPTGAGKTPQAICAVQALGAAPALVITSRKKTERWIRDLHLFARGAKVVQLSAETAGLFPPAHLMDRLEFASVEGSIMYDGLSRMVYEREKKYETLPEADFYICDFESLRVYGRVLAGVRTVIVDECHRIGQKPRMDGEQSAGQLDTLTKWESYVWRILENAYYRMFISSYQIERRPIRFYDILRTLVPGKLGSPKDYGMRYCDPKPSDFSNSGWEFNGASNTEELAEIVKDAVIRRSMDEIEAQAPRLFKDKVAKKHAAELKGKDSLADSRE